MKGQATKVIGSIMMNRALKYCEHNPDKNIPKLAHFVRRRTYLPNIQRFCLQAEQMMGDKENPYRNLIHRIFNNVAPEVRKKFVTNFVINASIIGSQRARKIKKTTGVNVPWAILMDPTSSCNLKCKGCWAGEYDKNDNLSFDDMDSIINEGKDLGVYFYLFSGGEPLVRKNDLLRLARKHSDCAFLSFTNGTLVDKTFAHELASLGNFALAISVEGEETATDFRRGNGVYRAATYAMDLLKKEGAPFGFSTCYHAKNVDSIADETYLDTMIAMGCTFGWFFTYIPCGNDALPELITPPDKRELMFDRVREWRKRKPIFLLDFWNDGDYSHGCIAGGKAYFHINAAGDAEPCAFIHYSDRNIHTSSLINILQSPLFKAYQKNQPFNENLLQPCPLLDNPQELRKIINETGAQSTQPLDKEDVNELTAKCENAANAWAPKAAELWGKLSYDFKQREERNNQEETLLLRRESKRN